MVSDAYTIKTVDDVIFEVDSQMITVKPGADVDIGANPSAEGGDEEVEDGAITVNNIVYSFRLQETAFDKKSFMTYIKDYMKKVKKHLEENDPEAVKTFEEGAKVAVKKILGNFKDYEFFTGESMDPEGMVVLLNYREDGVTPYLTFWKHGLSSFKC
ncbi:hypothetical protein TRICI_003349 [Trichomonascus ciferrii]|uniref:Translationally-controlled tumor protein homolog n=1 Tax=Trichomonascus ciferrii TaxID=44093 RepID=A0A642V3Z6_9ASCO|nr:hypothetical protein TRICI_003349 [Trichomonascus ciferrii]